MFSLQVLGTHPAGQGVALEAGLFYENLVVLVHVLGEGIDLRRVYVGGLANSDVYQLESGDDLRQGLLRFEVLVDVDQRVQDLVDVIGDFFHTTEHWGVLDHLVDAEGPGVVQVDRA